jgi:hypothetical protein
MDIAPRYSGTAAVATMDGSHVFIVAKPGLVVNYHSRSYHYFLRIRAAVTGRHTKTGLSYAYGKKTPARRPGLLSEAGSQGRIDWREAVPRDHDTGRPYGARQEGGCRTDEASGDREGLIG